MGGRLRAPCDFAVENTFLCFCWFVTVHVTVFEDLQHLSVEMLQFLVGQLTVYCPIPISLCQHGRRTMESNTGMCKSNCNCLLVCTRATHCRLSVSRTMKPCSVLHIV